MCISAERSLIAEGVLRGGSTARLWALSYADPVAQDLVEQVETNKVTIVFTPAMIVIELAKLQLSRDTDNATVDEYAEAVTVAKERYLAVVFLSGLAEYRYEQMLRTMENDYLRGDKLSYPTTLNKAYELATNWRGPGPKKTRGPHMQYKLGNTFVQSGGYHGKTNGGSNNNANTHTTTTTTTMHTRIASTMATGSSQRDQLTRVGRSQLSLRRSYISVVGGRATKQGSVPRPHTTASN